MCFSGEARTIVLIGCGGNGKSACGNSILGREAFKSEFSFGGVTKSCSMETSVLPNGQVLNVIDTPGFLCFNSPEAEYKILGSLSSLKDGVQAVVVVFTMGRFTFEDSSVMKTLHFLFGEKINDHMIILFTRGDDLQQDVILEDCLKNQIPEPLEEVLLLCNKRVVLFDNKTLDQKKKDDQLGKLLALVDSVIQVSGGKEIPLRRVRMREVNHGKAVELSTSAAGASTASHLTARMLAFKEQLPSSAVGRLCLFLPPTAILFLVAWKRLASLAGRLNKIVTIYAAKH